MKTKILSIALIGMMAILTSSWTTVNMGGGAVQTSNSWDVPFNPSFPHPCTGEMVNYTGTMHIDETVTITPNGMVHIIHNEQLQDVYGIGEITGNVYHYMGRLAINTNMNVGETWEGHQNNLLIGNGDNATRHVRILMMVNANGEVTVDRAVLSENCSN